MADLQKVRLMGTNQELVQRINDNFTEVETRKVDKELKTGSESVYKVLSDNNLTDAMVAEIASAAAKEHTHANKALLDSYDQTNADITSAVESKHTHSNKNLLDSYTQTEANLADAVTKRHAHVNKAMLDKITDTAEVPAESYDMKNLHTHSNKSVIDGITSEKVAQWDAAEPNVKPDWNAAAGSDAEIFNKPTSLPASDVYDWAKAATKPNYTAAEVGAIPATEKGVANGVATLGSDGKVPASQLPSYVDDLEEYADVEHFPATGDTDKIYIALDTNKIYRWSSTQYVEISASLALGETSSTAYRGDRGAAAYEHATETKLGQTAEGLYKIGVTEKGHVASATPVAKSDIVALGIPAQDTTYSPATTSADGLMAATDKAKLNGISAGANKVEASEINGNIKVDGQEVKVYTLPSIDQVVEYAFTSDDARWGATSGGFRTLTIDSTKRPFACYDASGNMLFVQLGHTGSVITVMAEQAFAGKVLAL